MNECEIIIVMLLVLVTVGALAGNAVFIIIASIAWFVIIMLGLLLFVDSYNKWKKDYKPRIHIDYKKFGKKPRLKK